MRDLLKGQKLTMATTTIISEYDFSRLAEVIRDIRVENAGRSWPRGDELERLLSDATKVTPQEVPADVVTMNSITRVRDVESEKEGVYNLVFPSDSKPLEGRVSVLSNLGIRLFGSRIGDVVDWETPNAVRRIEVIGLIYQPEAAQHWTL